MAIAKYTIEAYRRDAEIIKENIDNMQKSIESMLEADKDSDMYVTMPDVVPLYAMQCSLALLEAGINSLNSNISLLSKGA